MWPLSSGLSNELCNRDCHSAASGTRSSPNINWKLCSAGFQWWIIFQFFDASRIAMNSAFSAASSLGKIRRLRVYLRITMFKDSMALVV